MNGKVYVLLFLLVLVIAPALPLAAEPTAFAQSNKSNSIPNDISEELMDDIEVPDGIPEEGIELNMMFFTETASSENRLYYVCRRGTDAVAYFGKSMVKYLSAGTVFTLEFPGSNVVLPIGEVPTGSKTNYLYGNDPTQWRIGIEDYSRIRYAEIYPGIDLIYKIQDSNLKYEFVVCPYANPNDIQLHYSDADTIEIVDDMTIVTRDNQRIMDSQLQVFQKKGVTTVGCQFLISENGRVSFNLDTYDQSQELIIDPVCLAYSTFLGGTFSDYGNSLALENGYTYITGSTASTDFPLVNAYSSTSSGYDCFITKLASDGQSLVYSTYLGGSGYDGGVSITVENGYAYLTGTTFSSNFPVVNAYDSIYNGGCDCFVTKLASDGQSLVYSTFLGESDDDRVACIAVESGYAYVTGQTESTNFPIANAYDSTHNGGYDCFVTKLASDGQSLVYSTFLGGSGDDNAACIAVENEYAYITGNTFSSNFPVVNAYDSTHNDVDDCFVTKLASDGQSLVYSTFLGGYGSDLGFGIAVQSEYAYVTGVTHSGITLWLNFPVVNAYDPTYNGGGDCFVTKLASDGQSLVYSTFLGGSGYDVGRSIAVENGYVYVTGQTESTDFPIVNAYDSTHKGGYDCFVTKLTSDGQSLVYSTYLGGSDNDHAAWIAVESGYAYVTGETISTDYPVINAYDSAWGGGADCFISILVDEDSDSDSLCDWEEFSLYGTDPYCFDSDHDSFDDYYEIQTGTDPLDADNYPGMHYSLQYSSYLGGSLDDMGYSIAVEDGHIYITGKTHSGNFPTLNAIDGTHNGMGDVYVLKLAEDGRSIVYSTFIGGSDNDLGNSIAVYNGWVYVTGYTYSEDFPTVNGLYTTLGGVRDCFVLRLTPSGTSLWYSTYLGGSGDDFGESVAVWNGLAYVTGSTTSTGFPITPGAYDETHNGQSDVFVTKLVSDGSSLVYSTFLGGSENDYGHGIAVEDAYAYVTGTTVSAFPLKDPYDGTHDIGYDGFVSKLSLDGTSLIFSTYLGADSYDNPRGIAVEDGNAYIVGTTASLLFPTVHAYCYSHHGDTRDVFVTKFAADGQSLEYSTFLGDTGADYGLAIDVEDGYAGISGYTNSTGFPTTFNVATGLGQECFFTMLSRHGQSIVYSTVIGGDGDDRGQGISVYNGTIYATGITKSTDLPASIPFDSSYNGNWDAFVVVLGLDSDQDCLCDSWEDMLGTNPYHSDSDQDNYDDFYEFERGTDPVDPDHYPGMHFDLQYSSYLGGSADDRGQSIVVHDGYVYVTGDTESGAFPTLNALDSILNGYSDVFIVKLSFDCRALVYSTFLGGSSSDSALDLVVEGGYLYVTGVTQSPDFPIVNAYDSTYNGNYDCFVVKLAADGQSVTFSTFLGGWDIDYGRAIDVDDGCAYVTGYTESDDFPTLNAYDPALDGNRDCFVVKLTSDGQYLNYSTFLGGSNDDYSYSIEVEDGFAYVTGRTYSSDFPTANAYDSTHDGNWECFVTKLAVDGKILVYSTFLGDSGLDRGYSIAVEDGCAFVTGNTDSSGFPTANAYDSTYNGGLSDCFIAKIAADGQSLIYSTFLGGSGDDYGYSITIENGYAYVTGRTNSTNYPTSFLGEPGLGYDCFVTMLSKGGNVLGYSTYVGGEGDDQGMGIAVTDGTAYVTGYTDSSAFPTELALDPYYNGDRDSFLLVMGLDSDRDGVCNFWESMLGSDPYWIDSDNDNFLDYYEFLYGSNATDATDYPAMPQAWYQAIYDNLDGNATLIQNLITWSSGNASLLENVMQQLEDNAALLQQIISWLDGNHTAIEVLFTYVEGNATLLLNTIDAVDNNANDLALIVALATANYEWLEEFEDLTLSNLTLIREVLDMLGATVGDVDYDGLDDLDELDLGTDLKCIDTDCDNLNDAFEVKLGTDPLDDDSDGDSYLDGIEVIAGTNPLDALDYPRAGEEPEYLLFLGVVLVGTTGMVIVVVLVFLLKRRRSA